MFSRSTEFYDLIYSNFKDYETEADLVAARIRVLRPDARRLLDVACGTGEHALHLARRGYLVDGVDIEPSFVALASAKNRGGEGRFVQGDMTALELGARYDVVLCLFSSIGYALTVENLERAVAGFARHLRPGGLALVEPWFGPGQMTPGRVNLKTAEARGLTVCRMSHTEIAGRVSRLRFEYIIGDSRGLERRSELHELGLFTREEMERAFRRAGFRVELDEEGIYDRGLYFAHLEG
jgi:SAM-dependent methyltransferase